MEWSKEYYEAVAEMKESYRYFDEQMKSDPRLRAAIERNRAIVEAAFAAKRKAANG